MIYRLWAAWQKQRIHCSSKGETPAGKGALDEAFSLAAEAERATAQDEPFAAVFMDCSKCYERVDLKRLEHSQLPHRGVATRLRHVPRTKKDLGQWRSLGTGRRQ
eukprot:4426881-Amphidinium_carterae.1